MPTDRSKEKSFDELLNESEVKDFLFRAERDMLPKMKASAMSLVIGAEHADIKLALEVGAAILFDKPLLVVVPPGRLIPEGLRRVATLVLEDFDFTAPGSQAKLKQAIDTMMGRT
jgi:hypothetical protein